MTIEDLRNKGMIILECISGSRAYGLDTPTSDTDIKGVFLLPKEEFYGLNYIPQVSNESNDIVFFEFRRFMELLSVNNPNIIELLNTPEDSIIFKHPFLEDLAPKHFLSKLCGKTFGNYALSQIKKAKGLKKKITNPVPLERKSVLSFCHINIKNGSMPIMRYLENMQWNQEHCGLVKIPHMKDVFGFYHSERVELQGIIKNSDSNEVTLSSIPKTLEQHGILYFNRDGYSSYCKEYREYWAWVEKRNQERYKSTESHGKKYDAKNMMHVFRLLEMAIEIGKDSVVQVRRPNRSFLLDIKAGKYEYDELLNLAEKKQVELKEAYEQSALPIKPDLNLINKLAFEIRDRFYNGIVEVG